MPVAAFSLLLAYQASPPQEIAGLEAELAVIRKLGSSGGIEALPKLEPYVTGPQRELRVPAVEAIQAVTDRAFNHFQTEFKICYSRGLTELAKTKSDRFRIEFPKLLRYYGDDPELIVRIANDRRSQSEAVITKLISDLAKLWFGRDQNFRPDRILFRCGDGRPNMQAFFEICAENADLCIRLLRDPHYPFRGAIATGLRDCSRDDFEGCLVDLIKSPLSSVRSSAVDAMSGRRGAHIASALAAATSDPSVIVRYSVACTLADTPTPFTSSLLHVLSSDPDEDVRRMADYALEPPGDGDSP